LVTALSCAAAGIELAPTAATAANMATPTVRRIENRKRGIPSNRNDADADIFLFAMRRPYTVEVVRNLEESMRPSLWWSIDNSGVGRRHLPRWLEMAILNFSA
jgi:hypothetical protein